MPKPHTPLLKSSDAEIEDGRSLSAVLTALARAIRMEAGGLSDGYSPVTNDLVSVWLSDENLRTEVHNRMTECVRIQDGAAHHIVLHWEEHLLYHVSNQNPSTPEYLAGIWNQMAWMWCRAVHVTRERGIHQTPPHPLAPLVRCWSGQARPPSERRITAPGTMRATKQHRARPLTRTPALLSVAALAPVTAIAVDGEPLVTRTPDMPESGRPASRYKLDVPHQGEMFPGPRTLSRQPIGDFFWIRLPHTNSPATNGRICGRTSCAWGSMCMRSPEG